MRKTLKDVAKKAGVSIAVASRAMGSYGYVSKEAREKVLKVAKKIGYQPDIVARSLMTRKTHTMGMIISGITTLFFTSAVPGIEDVARGSGYNVLLCDSDENLAGGFDNLVGATGFEPVASCAPCKCAKPDCATPRSKYLVLLLTLFLGQQGRLNVLFLFLLTLLWLP